MTERLEFILIGHPLGHSLSPPIHQAAYAQLGASASYTLAPTPDEAALGRHFAALRSGVIAGANVTIPWKQRALELADERDPVAARVGAANVLSPISGGRMLASNTDVPALEDELRTHADVECGIVIGGGGAALASVQALALLNIKDVKVTTRRWAGLDTAAWTNAGRFRALGAEPLAWPAVSDPHWLDAVNSARVLVQATSAGMTGADSGEELAARIPWHVVRPDALAYDVVYNPARTPFLTAAERAGCVSKGGLGMLVGQARHAVKMWLGADPGTDVLREAAERALGS